ncbi:peptidyl-prolyl cis-trans isomerase [Burkholderiaceae bacterium DAT-1]|nr:peptidyl-prolyl cis-trans isomerase [Burkholderiaceae bacterium DAT-1]
MATRVNLHTNFGVIALELDEVKAPKTVANFVEYVNAGHYAGTIFHRVISDFMIQGGGFTVEGEQKETREPIENEAANGLSNDAYTIAMARTPNPHSASCQFFINTVKNDFLNYTAPNAQGFGYCVFGKVVEGQDVVDAIRKVPTARRGGHGDWPTEHVIIERAEVAAA